MGEEISSLKLMRSKHSELEAKSQRSSWHTFLQKVHVVSGKASSQSSLVCMQPTGKAMTIRMGRCSEELGCKDWQSEGSPAAMASSCKRSRVRCNLQEGHLHEEGLAPVPGGNPIPDTVMVTGQFREGQCERGVGEQEGSCRLIRSSFCECCAKLYLKGLWTSRNVWELRESKFGK